VGLLRSKLKEFLDLEQGNHSVFDYMRQFNTLAQYRSYHIDTDEKKVNLYRAGLTIHMQEHMVHLSSLSYKGKDAHREGEGGPGALPAGGTLQPARQRPCSINSGGEGGVQLAVETEGGGVMTGGPFKNIQKKIRKKSSKFDSVQNGPSRV
jgi:hypothetical protein